MVLGYFRAKAYNDYPVVGVSWEQANKYCRWRTDRANEKTLIYYGIINSKQRYVGKIAGREKLLDSTSKGNARLIKSGEEFIMVPDFRLTLLILMQALLSQTLLSHGAVMETMQLDLLKNLIKECIPLILKMAKAIIWV